MNALWPRIKYFAHLWLNSYTRDLENPVLWSTTSSHVPHMAKCRLRSLSCWARSHNTIISHENKCRSECRPCWTEWNEIPSCLWTFLVYLLELCCMATLKVSIFYGDWTLEHGGVFIPKLKPASRSAFRLHTVFLADNLVMKYIQEHSCIEITFKFLTKHQEFCSLFNSGRTFVYHLHKLPSSPHRQHSATVLHTFHKPLHFTCQV